LRLQLLEGGVAAGGALLALALRRFRRARLLGM
jgi:hypothetical protein